MIIGIYNIQIKNNFSNRQNLKNGAKTSLKNFRKNRAVLFSCCYLKFQNGTMFEYLLKIVTKPLGKFYFSPYLPLIIQNSIIGLIYYYNKKFYMQF